MLPWVPRASLSAWSRKIKIAAREMFWVMGQELVKSVRVSSTDQYWTLAYSWPNPCGIRGGLKTKPISLSPWSLASGAESPPSCPGPDNKPMSKHA